MLAGVFIMDRPLTVYIDFKSPYAYLAVAPTRLMARELGIQINWLPFVLDIPSYPRIRWQLEGEHGPAPDVGYELLPDDVVERATGRDLDVGISLEDPESYLATRQVLIMAEELDLVVNWYALPQKKPSSQTDLGDQSRGARHRRFRTENRERDQRRYMTQGLASGDIIAAATATLLEQNDIGLQEGALVEAWAGAGYVSSPVFRLGEETFVGRQHLPLIWARLERAVS